MDSNILNILFEVLPGYSREAKNNLSALYYYLYFMTGYAKAL